MHTPRSYTIGGRELNSLNNQLTTSTLSFCLLLSSALWSSATTRYVNAANSAPAAPYTDWTTAATNIQDAVNAASSGDLVLVTNGVYQYGGQIVYGSMSNRVAVTVPLTVQSVNGPAVTTILGYQVPGATNGNAAVRCVYLTNGAALAGFTLTNGATRAAGDIYQEESGGGVWCAGSNAVVVSNCVIAGNSAYHAGGGVYQGALNNCTLNTNLVGYSGSGGGAYNSTLSNCVLTGNSANLGGASGGGAYGGSLMGCTLNDNLAPSGVGGGAERATLANCTLMANFAFSGGGAGLSTLNNCLLSSNSALDFGGGAEGGTLNNCILTCNSALYGGGVGRPPALLTNCTLTGNSASQGGGAAGGTLVNCTLAGNRATNSDGGCGPGVLDNCIVYYNSAPTGTNFDSGSTLNYCCATPLPSTGSGNITNAPLFVNLAAGDFHLQSTSPCINAGNNSYAADSADFDGNPRISGGTVDIGAYEFQNPASIISCAWLEQYGLATDGSADHIDSDHNGMNNWQKWRAGLNPTNAASVLAMLSPTNSSSGINVTWESANGIAYYLQRAANLQAQPAFSSIQSNIVGQAVTTTYNDTNAVGPGPFFYRVGV
jgi:hypothetical protein